MQNRKKIFVTGISSLLLQQLVAIFPAHSYQIIGLSRNSIPNSNNQIVIGDMLQPAGWEHHLKDIDMVIHGAAITHTLHEATYMAVNVESTKLLIDLSKKYKVKEFVYISSRTAGLKSGGYGFSKYMAEQYLIENFKNYLILRPSEIFGGDKNEGIEKLIHDVLSKPFVFYPSQLEHKLYPIGMADTVQIMYNFISNKSDDSSIQTINGPVGYDFNEIISLINKIAGKNTISIPIPKFVMYLLKKIISLFNLKLGIVPDQVDRLYCEKEIAFLDYNFTTLENYIKKKSLEI